MNKYFALCFVICSLLPAFGEIPEAATELETGYQAAMKALDSERDQQLATLAHGYTQALDRQSDSYQQAGDLDGMLAVAQEKKRFAEAEDVSVNHTSSPFVELADLQARLKTALAAIQAQHGEKANALRIRYVAKLDSLTTKLTTAGNIDAAIAVREYRESLAKAIHVPDQPIAEVMKATPPTLSAPSGRKDLTFNGKRYRIVNGGVAWWTARKAAKEAGGDLVVIETKAEHDFLLKALGDRRAWIGARIRPEGESAEWVNGTPLKKIPNVPYRNNGKKENAQFMTLSPEMKGWDDITGNRTKRVRAYIIEF